MNKPDTHAAAPGQMIGAPFQQPQPLRVVVDMPDGQQLKAGWDDSFQHKLKNHPVITAAAAKADMAYLQREVYEPMRAKQFQNSQKPFHNRRK